MVSLHPDSYGARLREANPCHEPAGSPKGGQFCSTLQPLSVAIGEYREGQDINAYMAQKDRWRTQVERALTFGTVTLDQARELGYHTHEGFEAKEWGPLPETLYHVTINASAVMAGRLKTRSELRQQRGLGLGGGTDRAISLTTDRETAGHIYDALLEMRAVARGEITAKQLMAEADRGFRAKTSYGNSIRKAYGGDAHSFQLQVDGWRSIQNDDRETRERLGYETKVGAISRAEVERHGFRLHPEGKYWNGRDEQFAPDWAVFRPMTEAEQRSHRVDLYKNYLFMREQAGGPINPLFFVSDEEGLAKIDPDEVAILTLKPRKGAHGWRMSGLKEWRTWHGAAVRPVKAEKPQHSFRSFKEANSCHKPAGNSDGGQFCSNGRSEFQRAFKPEKLLTLMNRTTLPSETKFLLPDGTRLKMADNYGEHRDALGAYNLADVLAAGVIRYRAESGVNPGARITQVQAQTIADDWNYVHDGVLWVDLGPNHDHSREFRRPVNADALRRWVNQFYPRTS